YTAKYGSDSYDCAQAQSLATPKQTINEGLNCLSGGDTLLIRAGTYDEGIDTVNGSNLPSGPSPENPTTIAAFPPACSSGTLYGPGANCYEVIIRPWSAYGHSDTGIDAYQRSNLVFDGMIVDGGNVTNPLGYGMGAVGDHIRLLNIQVQNTACGGLGITGEF